MQKNQNGYNKLVHSVPSRVTHAVLMALITALAFGKIITGRHVFHVFCSEIEIILHEHTVVFAGA